MKENGLYDSTRRAWEEIWDGANIQVELEAVQSARAQATIAAYLPYLSRDDIHLEAGSGLSAVVIALRQRGYRVVGMDYAVNALRYSRAYDPSLPLFGGDVHALPHPDDCFGSYLSFGVLEHFEHGMMPALKEAYRVVKRGGVIVLTIPYPNLVYRLVQLKRRLLGRGTLADADFYESAYTRAQLIAQVEAAGFTVEQALPTSHDFTLWGLGGPFRAPGYYRTSPLAETIGSLLAKALPWAFNYMTLIIGRK